jgi:hypothetical protein
MSKFIVIFYSLLLVACGLDEIMGKSDGQSKRSSDQLKKESPIRGKYTSINERNSNSFQCLLTRSADKRSHERPTNTDRTLFIPKELSSRILQDLRVKAVSKKLNPETIWLSLDSDHRRELSEILFNKYISLADENYRNILRVISVGLTLFVETGEQDKIYEIKTSYYGDQGPFRIAFGKKVTHSIDLDDCDRYDIMNIKIADQQIMPSSVLAHINCENGEDGKEELLRIHSIRKETTFSFTYKTKFMERERNMTLERLDFQEVADREKQREFTYIGNSFKQFKLIAHRPVHYDNGQRFYKPNVFHQISLSIKDFDGNKIRLKRLDCDFKRLDIFK